MKNTSIETLDLSDNDLTDQHGEYITTLIKSQSEQRDNQIWAMGLRQKTAEDHLNEFIAEINLNITN